jgi:hypothetical protein
VLEDQIEHHDHQDHQRGRDDHVEELDRCRPPGDDEPGDEDRADSGDDHLDAGGIGGFPGTERRKAVDRPAEHHGKHRKPAHGEHDHGQHVDDAAAVVAELAAQRDELLDAVAAGQRRGGERRQHHADNVADDDGGNALLRPDEEAHRAADQEGPGGDGKRRIGVGEFPEAPEPLGRQQRRVAAFGGGAVALGLSLFRFDGGKAAVGDMISHLTPPRSRSPRPGQA